MNPFFTVLLILSISNAFLSCGSKTRLNLTDNQLISSIEHPDSALSIALKANTDNFPITLPQKGQKYSVIRGKSAGLLPIIDFTGKKHIFQALMLSQIAENIIYTKITPPFKNKNISDPRKDKNTRYMNEYIPWGITKTKNHFIINGIHGVFLYSKNGSFLDTLYSNKVTIQHFNKTEFMFAPERSAFSKPAIDEAGNMLYLIEIDREKKQNRLLVFQADFLNNAFIDKTVKEKKNSPLKLSKVFKLDKQDETLEWLTPNILIAQSGKRDAMTMKSNLMVVLSPTGDTLCTFQNNLRIKPFVSGSYRTPENRKTYFYNHQYTFKQEYNDTVFRVIPPNQLLPVYVFNFGDKKLSSEVAYNPKINIDATVHFDDFIETPNYIIAKLVLGFDCPNSRKEGKVHFRGIYYDKRSGKVFDMPGKGNLPEDFNLPNDIDGGLPFWPKEITDNGEMISWIDGKTMKETLTNEWFAKSPAPPNRKAALQEYLKTVEDDDTVIITVK